MTQLERPAPCASSSSLNTISEDGRRQLLTSSPREVRLPTLSRFLADFTLGFADGLTVPFALTAGLTSLGETRTVIYAGMAEICAGSISSTYTEVVLVKNYWNSLTACVGARQTCTISDQYVLISLTVGIGGYLAARSEQTLSSRHQLVTDGCEDGTADPEKTPALSHHEMMDDYLAPLRLPSELLEALQRHVQSHPTIVDAVRSRNADGRGPFEERPCSSTMIGLSVSVGYLLGGLLPLFPYFFVTEVGNGLRWSFAVCILALFLFGFTKTYVLQTGETSSSWDHVSPKWRRIRCSLWEGLQMVVLGSVAALAAVLAVRAFEGWSD